MAGGEADLGEVQAVAELARRETFPQPAFVERDDPPGVAADRGQHAVGEPQPVRRAAGGHRDRGEDPVATHAFQVLVGVDVVPCEKPPPVLNSGDGHHLRTRGVRAERRPEDDPGSHLEFPVGERGEPGPAALVEDVEQGRLAGPGQEPEMARHGQRGAVLGDLAPLDVDVRVAERAGAAGVVEVVVRQDDGVHVAGAHARAAQHLGGRRPLGMAVFSGQPPVRGVIRETGVHEDAALRGPDQGEAVGHPPVALVGLRREQVAGRKAVDEAVFEDPDRVVSVSRARLRALRALWLALSHRVPRAAPGRRC